ncbi:glycosyltransferase [Catalinimonas sp. 4WD22]|uniref:glycosyltransferase family 4 protein n=1 Tax=Catalinimonas locisalis TaxID=3133978 RepID=UPI00310140AE
MKDVKNALEFVRPSIVYWRYNKKNLLLSAFYCKLYGAKVVFSISSFGDTQRFIWTGSRPFENLRNNFSKSNSLLRKVYSLRFIRDPIKSYFNFLGFYFVDGIVGIQKKLTGIAPVKKQIAIYNSMVPNFGEGYAHNKPYVVWVANIKSRKNPEAYISLAQQLQDEHIDFFMIGEIQQETYKEVLQKDNLPENLIFLGPKSIAEVDNILKSSLFLVHTCDPEGFGNNFIQAWFQSKPTITLYFDPDDIIKTYHLGYHSGSILQMVKDAKELIQRPELRNEIGERAKEFAVKNFTLEQNAHKFESFFLKIAGK